MGIWPKKINKHEGQAHVMNYKQLADGGIYDEWIPKADIDPTWLQWVIFGQKYYFRGYHVDGTVIPIVPVGVIKVKPRRVGRIIGCLPRQKLEACNKDLWQKLAPYAPVVVIGLGMIILIIMVG